MNTSSIPFPHDLDLGARPAEEELQKWLYEQRGSKLLLGLMHYLRDGAALAIGESVAARMQGNVAAADMEQGAHVRLLEVLVKWDEMRRTAPEEKADS